MEQYVIMSNGERSKTVKNSNMVLSVVGTKYRDNYRDLMEHLYIGTSVEIRREVENQYDDDALGFYLSDGTIIGYVPKNEKTFAKAFLNNGIAKGSICVNAGDRIDVKVMLDSSMADYHYLLQNNVSLKLVRWTNDDEYKEQSTIIPIEGLKDFLLGKTCDSYFVDSSFCDGDDADDSFVHYKMPTRDKPFNVWVEIEKVSEEWAEMNLQVGTYVTLRPYDDEVLMYCSGRKCGRVRSVDIGYLELFLGDGKVGKITSVPPLFIDEVTVSVFPYSDYQQDPKAPRLTLRKPKTDAEKKREAILRKEKEEFSFSEKDDRFAVVIGSHLFINNTRDFNSFLLKHRDWCIKLKRKRAGDSIIIGAYISDRLIGYVSTIYAKRIGCMFNEKTIVAARIRTTYIDDNGILSFLVGINKWDQYSFRDSFGIECIQLMDKAFPPKDNVHHPLAAMWKHDSPDKNATSNRLSIKSDCYKLVEKYFESYADKVYAILYDRHYESPKISYCIGNDKYNSDLSKRYKAESKRYETWIDQS